MKTGDLHGSERGFSLIEIVITIIILGIATGILVPFIVSLRGSANPVLMEQAVVLSQERLEQMIADRRDSATPRGFRYATTPANYPNENPVAGYPDFTRSVTIMCVTTANLDAAGTAPNPSCALADGLTDYARVTVTVTNTLAGSVAAVGLLTNY